MCGRLRVGKCFLHACSSGRGSHGPTTTHVQLIVALAARHRLPAVYPYRFFVSAGGLISYGPDLIDQHRRAAGYVDRILKGEGGR